MPSPCRYGTDHILVFDEDYYVNAARVIAGIHPPAGAPYDSTPLGDDGNSEHPQLAKLLIAGGIELFGDGPLAWRLPSVLLGVLTILGMFVLVRSAGGSPWLGLGAATLMACDNLLLVHSRIGTLDIYATAGMVWGAVLYLRNRPLLAGGVIALGASAKEVAPYVLLALAILELLRWCRTRDDVARRVGRLVACAVASAVAFFVLLTVMGWIAPPYSPQTGKRVPGGAIGHIEHILTYAAGQTSPHGPQGIASYPWDWLVDIKPITYLQINPAPSDRSAQQHRARRPLPRSDQPARSCCSRCPGCCLRRGRWCAAACESTTRWGSSGWPGSSVRICRTWR